MIAEAVLIQVPSLEFKFFPVFSLDPPLQAFIEMLLDLLDTSQAQVIKFIKVRNAREMKGSFWNPF